MQIFAVIAPEPNASLKEAITGKFRGRYFEVAPGQFLVCDPKATTQQVSSVLGLTEGKLGRAMVLHVVNWNGWHDKDVWEWMTAQTNDPSPTTILGY
jgi:hypothetical protein